MPTESRLSAETMSRELREELDTEIPVVALPSRAPAPIAEVRPRRIPAGDLSTLCEDREPVVALNVRVPTWVSAQLEQKVLEMKMTGRRIKKERVVAEALISYLRLERPQ
jgi:hypothetical protein